MAKTPSRSTYRFQRPPASASPGRYNSASLAEAQVLEIIRDMLASPYETRLSVKDITSWFVDRHGQDYEKKITTKWVGSIIRRRLRLKTQRDRDGYLIQSAEKDKFPRLYEKYGVGRDETGPAPAQAP